MYQGSGWISEQHMVWVLGIGFTGEREYIEAMGQPKVRITAHLSPSSPRELCQGLGRELNIA